MSEKKYFLFVESYPSHPTRHDEFNEWYETTHIPEVAAQDGIVKATRFAPKDDPMGSYFTIYELEGDPEEAVHNIHQASADGKLNMSDVLSLGPIPKMRIMEMYSEYTPPAESSDR